jgi:exodeoxyribonuclease V
MTAPALRVIQGGIPDWSAEQLAALDRIAAWRRAPRSQIFTLHGYAGTGKSTLLREVARNVANVVFVAPTGRAAAVMRRKGCAAATTIDRAIYHHPFAWRCGRCEAPPCRDLCPHVRQEWLGKHIDPRSEAALAELIILDEASMVGPDAAADLLSLGRPILAVGDPGQLPPVNGAGVFAQRAPDVLLAEIHRQAAGDPIVWISSQIRAGRIPDPGEYGDSEITRKNPDKLSGFDAVICGRNATRRQINREIRRELGFDGPLPHAGERLLVLRNRHEKGLSNGDVVRVLETGVADGGFLPITVETDDGRAVEIEAPVDALTRDDVSDVGAHGDPVVWGYGLTCHKAQGSQWDNVLVADESWCFRENAARWLYTAVTRAAVRLTLLTHRGRR